MALVLVALGFAGAAAAGKPDKFPTPIPAAHFDAGELCPFELSWETTKDDAFAIYHVDHDYLWGGGRNFALLTNLDSGNTMVVNSTGPGKLTFTEGGVDIVGGGHWLVGETSDDPAPTAPGLWLYSGHIHITFDPVNGTQIVGYDGTAPIDVCAALA
jgi:hypothetical protein